MNEIVTICGAVSGLIAMCLVAIVVRWALESQRRLIREFNEDRAVFHEHSFRQWQAALNASQARSADEYNRLQRADRVPVTWNRHQAGAAVPPSPAAFVADIDEELKAMGLVDDRAPILRSVPDADAPPLPEGM
jgi:hypothetical protein